MMLPLTEDDTSILSYHVNALIVSLQLLILLKQHLGFRSQMVILFPGSVLPTAITVGNPTLHFPYGMNLSALTTNGDGQT
jgi:hypothetical protein